MKLHSLKSWQQLWQRFQRWQREPMSYEFASQEVNHCANCGHDYTGNFCPYCSQQCGVGRIGWETVRKGVMEVWGLHSRSLIYSLLQLMIRPGYFINDYINGRRQVSFPPVKMLILMSVVSVLIDKLTIKMHTMERAAETIFKGHYHFTDTLLTWFQSNPGWGWLMVNLFLLVPIWLLLRHSPLNRKHTLPQGFFIIVFLSIQSLIIDNIADCSFSILYLISPILVVITFKQLFGYGIWGTTWRTLIALTSGAVLALSTAMIYDTFENRATLFTWNMVAMLAINILILGIGAWIDKLCENRRIKKNRYDQTTAADTSRLCLESAC